MELLEKIIQDSFPSLAGALKRGGRLLCSIGGEPGHHQSVVALGVLGQTEPITPWFNNFADLEREIATMDGKTFPAEELAPRYISMARARLKISEVLIQASSEHGLGHTDMVAILTEQIAAWTKPVMRDERAVAEESRDSATQ